LLNVAPLSHVIISENVDTPATSNVLYTFVRAAPVSKETTFVASSAPVNDE
jgi:hypothetical protein